MLLSIVAARGLCEFLSWAYYPNISECLPYSTHWRLNFSNIFFDPTAFPINHCISPRLSVIRKWVSPNIWLRPLLYFHYASFEQAMHLSLE